jgi:hypothetical protein
MMISDAITKYINITESLKDSDLFILKSKEVFATKYKISETPIHFYIEVYAEEYLRTAWSSEIDSISYFHNITGEEAFNAMPDMHKEEAIFYLDIFSLKDTYRT